MDLKELPSNLNRKKELEIEVISLIGEGTYGQVYKVRILSDLPDNIPKLKEYALKVISKSTKSNINEVKIINYINSKIPYCTSVLLCYYDISEDSDNFYLLSELMDYDLYDFQTKVLLKLTGKVRLNLYFSIFYNCLIGLKSLEEIGIVHRDIKPENILVKKYNNEYRFYISDFGLSCEPIDCRNISGTDIYIDPYVYMQSIYDKSFINNSSQSDIYSLATTMYSILTNNNYFNEDEMEELEDINRTNNSERDEEIKAMLSDKIYSLYITCYDKAIMNLDKYQDFLDERLVEVPDDKVYINVYKMISFIIYNLKPFRKNRDTPDTALSKLMDE